MMATPINTWIGDGVLVELYKTDTEFVVEVYGAAGRRSAEVRVADADSVWPLVRSLLEGHGLHEIEDEGGGGK